MDIHKEYERWLHYPDLPETLRYDLKSIEGNESEIAERFGESLQFGTGGIRGVLGAGPNRLNIYTVRSASLALAQEILQQGEESAKRGIVIGYDSRHMSREFAEEVGRTVAAQGVCAYVAPQLCPTPEVSFSLRHLKAAGGVMITASHNPPEYNGYKAYGPDGAQLLPDASSRIGQRMQENGDVFDIPVLSEADADHSHLFRHIPQDVHDAYIEAVVNAIRISSVGDATRGELSLVYTPLFGTGNIPVQEALQRAGYRQVSAVLKQTEPNGDFPGLKTPNPGEAVALTEAICLARDKNADLVLGTDPDCDRVGIAVRTACGDYQHLTGNQVGALLTDFLLQIRKAEGRLPQNGVVFKTIVTSSLGEAVATSYGIRTKDVLTGFKYIGSGITEYEQTQEHTFLFGYEESYGYLISPIVRDKDGVQASLAVAEMAAFYKAKGKTLLDALDALYRQFGFYEEKLYSVPLGEDGHGSKKKSIMDGLRKEPPTVEGLVLRTVEDYLNSTRVHVDAQGTAVGEPEELSLPQSDVLKYSFTDESWLAIRPSGTEPKIKAYFAARGDSRAECEKKIARMQAVMESNPLC